MKYVLNEKQIDYIIKNHIFEQLDIDREEDDQKIASEFENIISWFDYMPQSLRDYFAEKPFGMTFEKAMSATMDFLNQRYDLKRVVVKDKDAVVGMLIYSFTDKDFEDIENDEVFEGEQYPIVLAAAVHPNYRQKGLLKMMLTSAPVNQPFLVQTSQISTPKVWEKLGCKMVQDLSAKYGEGNAIELCKESVEILKENKVILKIRDLARGLANQFGDDAEYYYDEFVVQLANIYKKHGDEGVMAIFKDSSGGIELEPMGHARYVVK